MKHVFKEIGNSKIFYDYEVVEELECGMKLSSEQVKQVFHNKFNIVGNWCKIMNGELYMIGQEHTVKLLARKSQIKRLIGKVHEKGYTLAPISIYSVRGKFKLKVGLVKGKKEYDKRESEKKRDNELETRRIVKSQKLREE